MRGRSREKSNVVESWGMTIGVERGILVHLLRPGTVAEQERALSRFKASGFQEAVSRSISSDFVGTLAAGFYGGDRNTPVVHGFYELQPGCYQGTLSRLALTGTYNGQVITYDDFVDNPSMAGNVAPVSHTHRMLVGAAMRDIAAELQAEQSRGWSVLREATV